MKKSDFLFFGIFVLLVVGCASQNQVQLNHRYCFDCNDKDTTKGPCYKPIDGTTHVVDLTSDPGTEKFHCWARVPTGFDEITKIERGGANAASTEVGNCVEMPIGNQMYMVCYCNADKCIPDSNRQVRWLSTSSTATTTIPPSTVPLSKVAPVHLADGDYGALFSVDKTSTPPPSSPMTLLGDDVEIDLKKAKDSHLRAYLLVNKGAEIKFWLYTIEQPGIKDTKVKFNIAGFPLEIKLTQDEKSISSGDRSLDLAKLTTLREFKITKDGSLEFLYFGPRDFAPGIKKQAFDIPYYSNKEAFLVELFVTKATDDPPLKFLIEADGMQLTLFKPFVDLTPKPDHEPIILLCIAPLVFLFPIAIFIIVHCVYKKVYLKPPREDKSARTSPVDTKLK